MINILIAEDDANIRRLMSIWLQKAGFHPLTAENGEQAVECMQKNKVHLLLADLMMPVLSGVELLKYMHEQALSVPVIVTTALESIEDKKTCFELGADDYLVKPINREELILRINAVLKRSRVSEDVALCVGDVLLNDNTMTVSDKENSVTLSKKEFGILLKLLSSPNRVYTKAQLMDEFWGYDSESYEDTVKVHINRIRAKIEKFPQIGIATIRGVGYKGDIHV